MLLILSLHSIPLSWLSPLLYCQALPLNLKTISSLIKTYLDCASTSFCPLCLVFWALLPSTVWFLLSLTIFKGHQMPKAVNTFQSLFCCLHLLPSLKLFLWRPWHHLYSVLLPDSSAFSLWIFSHLPRTFVFVKKLVLGYFMIALHSP